MRQVPDFVNSDTAPGARQGRCKRPSGISRLMYQRWLSFNYSRRTRGKPPLSLRDYANQKRRAAVRGVKNLNRKRPVGISIRLYGNFCCHNRDRKKRGERPLTLSEYANRKTELLRARRPSGVSKKDFNRFQCYKSHQRRTGQPVTSLQTYLHRRREAVEGGFEKISGSKPLSEIHRLSIVNAKRRRRGQSEIALADYRDWQFFLADMGHSVSFEKWYAMIDVVTRPSRRSE